MNITFERATKADVGKLIEIQNICFYDDYTKFGKCPAYNETPEHMANQIETRICYKIIIDGVTAGDIIVRPDSENQYYIRVLSILPQYQGKGAGTAALRFLFEQYPNVSVWELVTPIKNKKNCSFYEKAGFIAAKETNDGDVKLNLYRCSREIP
ncbi:MAG: GNAT family N-acetyltransferase [Firmicutes bacterium]|nr:GNAT family N-acetyltransferase [Bacillota bacterium]